MNYKELGAEMTEISLVDQLRSNLSGVVSPDNIYVEHAKSGDIERFVHIFKPLVFPDENSYEERMKLVVKVDKILNDLGYRGYTINEFDCMIQFVDDYEFHV